MHGKLPKVRPDDPSAEKAIGFCFIPFFNLYWIFFTFRRLCLRLDEQRDLYGLPPARLGWLATTSCVLTVIPYANFLFGFPFVIPVFAGNIQALVNELVKRSATSAPRMALSATPPPASRSSKTTAAILCSCALAGVVTVTVLAALFFSALAGAREKALTTLSMNNMKQIGLYLRVWAGENIGQFPAEVSQTNGGIKELCITNKDGFLLDPAPFFKALSSELRSPNILLCPDDSAKTVASDFANLTSNNITYQVRVGPEVTLTNYNEIIMVDPIHGLALRCDGGVIKDPRYKAKQSAK